MKHRTIGRGRGVALVLIGVIGGGLLLTPAGAHVGGTVNHLWSKHIKPKVTSLVYTKAKSDGRFVRKSSDTWHELNAVGGAAPAFRASTYCGWKNYDPASFNTAAFYKDSLGTVHLKGLVDADDLADSGCVDYDPISQDWLIFLLPEGYRPAKNELYATDAGNGHARLNVRPDGWVHVEPAHIGAAESWLSLDGVTFQAAPPSVAAAAAAKLQKPKANGRAR